MFGLDVENLFVVEVYLRLSSGDKIFLSWMWIIIIFKIYNYVWLDNIYLLKVVIF